MRSLFKSSLPHFQVISTILHVQDPRMVEFYWEGLIVREKVLCKTTLNTFLAHFLAA